MTENRDHGTDAVECAHLLRSWAKAYRDGPEEHRFPSDPHSEFFPPDLERAAKELDTLRAALQQIITVCDDNEPQSCNQAMALKFVRDVARSTIGEKRGPMNDQHELMPAITFLERRLAQLGYEMGCLMIGLNTLRAAAGLPPRSMEIKRSATFDEPREEVPPTVGQ